jgi:hypothetical protein
MHVRGGTDASMLAIVGPCSIHTDVVVAVVVAVVVEVVEEGEGLVVGVVDVVDVEEVVDVEDEDGVGDDDSSGSDDDGDGEATETEATLAVSREATCCASDACTLSYPRCRHVSTFQYVKEVFSLPQLVSATCPSTYVVVPSLYVYFIPGRSDDS